MPNSTVWISVGITVGLVLTALVFAALSRRLHRSRNADAEVPPVREMEGHSDRNRVGSNQVSVPTRPNEFSLPNHETHQFLAARDSKNAPLAAHTSQKQIALEQNDAVDPTELSSSDEQVVKLRDPAPRPTMYQLPNHPLTGIKSHASIFASTASLSTSRASNLNSVYATPTSSVGSIFVNSDTDAQVDDVTADVKPVSVHKKALFFSASSLLDRDA
ncbi:hypothetical protein HDU81_009495 [Chytriomyces hyalinus]|nr:hypothetical protein HDU81_009495 [Chytriomyces hyalinus]